MASSEDHKIVVTISAIKKQKEEFRSIRVLGKEDKTGRMVDVRRAMAFQKRAGINRGTSKGEENRGGCSSVIAGKWH